MIRPFGEAALLVELDGPRRVQAAAETLLRRPIAGMLEVVPGVDTLLVEIAAGADSKALRAALQERVAELHAAPQFSPARTRSIPCLYGGDAGPDLEEVAGLAGLPPAEVVARHAATKFTVDLLGFAPGFAYLGGLPDELRVPRLATPRTVTPAGAVALAGSQSGIYPAALPGGWRVIGRTPRVLFDADRDPPAYLAPGDRVRFSPITAEDWERHAGLAPDW